MMENTIVDPRYQDVLLRYYRKENEPDPDLIPLALAHYNECRVPTCEICHLARMIECNVEETTMNMYKRFRKDAMLGMFIRDRTLRPEHPNVPTELLEYFNHSHTSNHFIYVTFLVEMYTRWRLHRQNSSCTESISTECLICAKEYDKIVRMTLNCGHTICSECCTKIRSSTNVCPECRQLIFIAIPIVH